MVMADINRRFLTLLALLAPLVRVCSQPQTPSAISEKPQAHRNPGDRPTFWKRNDQIAMLLYPQMTVLDLIGPQYMFALLQGAEVHLVAKSLAPVTSDTGVTVAPTTTFDGCPKHLTVLFAPGGSDAGSEGVLAAMEDAETRAFMADRGSRASYVTSVCTGSLVLGAAGLLKGYKATSHWAAREVLADFGAIPTDARVVRDRNRITGAGVTAGLDFGLQMAALLRDPNYAECMQLMCEYDPHPPFDAGSLHSAPAAVQSTMSLLLSGFTASAHARAKNLSA
jgi:cyclohexyl-isocyanide hydratase